MSRILTTLFAVFFIAVVAYSISQAQNAGAPWMFTAFGILIIIRVVVSLVRVWLRR